MTFTRFHVLVINIVPFDKVLEHIVASLSDEEEEEEREDLQLPSSLVKKKEYFDNTESAQSNSTNVIKCDNDEDTILEEEKEEDRELCQVYVENTKRCDIVCENLLKKENVGQEEVSFHEEAKENVPLAKITSEKKFELIHQLVQRLEEKMDMIQFEIGALEESNSYLTDQEKRRREELDEVSGHREECGKQMRAVRDMNALYDERMSVFTEMEALSLDEQIRTKCQWYDLKSSLRSEVRAFDDALFVLTLALQRKTIKLNGFLSSCQEIGRQKFQAKCRIKLIKSKIKKANGIKI